MAAVAPQARHGWGQGQQVQVGPGGLLVLVGLRFSIELIDRTSHSVVVWGSVVVFYCGFVASRTVIDTRSIKRQKSIFSVS